ARHDRPKGDRERDHHAEIEPPAGVVRRAGSNKDDSAHEAEPDDRLKDEIQNETHFLPFRSNLILPRGERRCRIRSSSRSPPTLPAAHGVLHGPTHHPQSPAVGSSKTISPLLLDDHEERNIMI